MFKKNDEIEVNIIDYGANGEGVAKVDNFTIFVNGAIKQEKCKVIITKVLKTHAFAKAIEITHKSKNRVQSDCKTYPRCGGCSLRHIKYEETLKIKKEKVQNLIERNVDKNLKVNDCIGMENPFYYRNKAIYPIKYCGSDIASEKDSNSGILAKSALLVNNNTKKVQIEDFLRYDSNDEELNKNNNFMQKIVPGIYAKRSHIVIPFEECKIQTKISQEIAKYICKNWKAGIYVENKVSTDETKLNVENNAGSDETKFNVENNAGLRETKSNLQTEKINNEQNKTKYENYSTSKQSTSIIIKNNSKASTEESKQNHKKDKAKDDFKTAEQGILRNIMIREGFESGEILVALVESKFEKNALDIEKLIKEFPNIKTVVANINPNNTNVVLSNKNIILYGNGFITDKIGDYTFKISTNSFYQVNPKQTKVIYETAIKEANLNKNDTLCDLYSGIGTIGIFASKYVNKVYGIEIVDSAIKDARENARINNVKNIEFIEGDVETAFDKLLKNNTNPNAVIVDPPRKGLDEKTIENLCDLKLEKLVYVSCNPATLARDLAILQNVYEIKSITPIDNFPYSTHVETVVALNGIKSNK